MSSGSDRRSRGRYNGPFQQQQRGPQRNLTLDSSGPNVKVRGSAYQVFERYVALAREAASNGDPVAAENLYQYAEHYFRVYKASRERDPQEAPQPITPDDPTMGGSDQGSSEADTQRQPDWDDDRRGFV